MRMLWRMVEVGVLASIHRSLHRHHVKGDMGNMLYRLVNGVLWQMVEVDILDSIHRSLHRHHVKGDVDDTLSGLINSVLWWVVEVDILGSIHRSLHRHHVKGDMGDTLSGLVDGAHSSWVQGSALLMAPLSRTGSGQVPWQGLSYTPSSWL